MDFQECIELFLDDLKKNGSSSNTIIAYRSTLNQFFSMYPSVSVVFLRDYRERLLKQYRSSTVNAKISALNRFLIFLGQWEEDHSDETESEKAGASFPYPEFDSLPSSYRLLSVRHQQKTYLDTVISEEDYEHLKTCLWNDGDITWFFLVHFLGSTGVRVGELIQIKIEHLRLGYMDICSKGGKVRRIYFPEHLCRKALSWYTKAGKKSGFLFTNKKGKPFTPRWINTRLKYLAVRYHINPDTVYPHSFRHRFAKNFLKKSNDIALLADLLGHESIETTRIYLTKSSLEQRQVIDSIVTW